LGQILDVILVAYSFFFLSLFITDYSFVNPTISINNIIAPTIGLGLLFLLRWLARGKSLKNSIIIAFYLRFRHIKDKNLVALLFVLTFLLFSIISIARHFSLCSGGWDLGIFDQAVWNVTKGNSLFCSIKYPQGGNLLGDHFEPILFFIAPLYLLWPNVLVLIILQSFLLASAIIPLYLIAKSILKDRFVIFAFLVCYILSKPLRGIVFSDFHPEAFIVPALFWGYYFLIKRKNVFLWLSIIVLLLCKEDATFLVLGFGLFALIIPKRRLIGLSFVAVSIFLWWLETGIIIPYFSPTHHFQYLSKMPFGVTYLDNVKFCFLHPLLFIKFIFSKYKISYILRLFAPLCFLSLLSPPQYILVFFPLFKNLLESPGSTLYCTFHFHYAAGVLPFVFISAIYGCHALLKKLRMSKSNVIVGLFLIGFSLLFFGETDGYRFAGFLNNMKVNHAFEKIRSLHLIPPEASVLATGDICAHLSHRKYIYDLSNTEGKTIFPEYIVIDRGVFGNEYLTSKQNSTIDNYLSVAQRKGYKIISNVQNRSFMILTNTQS